MEFHQQQPEEITNRVGQLSNLLTHLEDQVEELDRRTTSLDSSNQQVEDQETRLAALMDEVSDLQSISLSLSRMVWGLVQHPRDSVTYLHEDEADGPPYSGIGPLGGAEEVDAEIDVQLFHQRTAYYDHVGRTRGAGRGGVEAEFVIAHGLYRGQQYGHVLGEAARHDTVDSHLLRRDDPVPGGDRAYHIVRGPAPVFQELDHPLRSGGTTGRPSVIPSR